MPEFPIPSARILLVSQIQGGRRLPPPAPLSGTPMHWTDVTVMPMRLVMTMTSVVVHLFCRWLAADLLQSVDVDCAVNVVRPHGVTARAWRQVEALPSQLRPTHPGDASRGRVPDETQPRDRITRSEPVHGRGSTQDHQRQVSSSVRSASIFVSHSYTSLENDAVTVIAVFPR